MLAVESVKAVTNSVSFVKGKKCNDKSPMIPPLMVVQDIIALTNKIIYDDVISHGHRHASCVYKLSSCFGQPAQNIFR